MDPLTQGLLGSVAAQAVCGRWLPRSAWVIGLAAGLAADLDIVIRPSSDPLGGLLWHRHFTHAAVFVPVGAAVCAMPFLWWQRRAGRRRHAFGAVSMDRAPVRAIFAASFIGYATHGPLDAATSYGTYLWWPFSGERVAWDILPIIDPIFTGVLLIGLIAALIARRTWIAAVALGLAVMYGGLGFVQRERVQAVQERLASARGHSVAHGRVMPAPLSLLLWNSIYVSDGVLHADAVRVSWLGETHVFPGGSVARQSFETISLHRSLSELERITIGHWDEFADGFVATDPRDPNVLGDMRYLLKPDRMEALWGLELPEPGTMERPRMIRFTRGGEEPSSVRWAWSAVLGRNTDFVPVEEVLRRME